MTLKFIMLVGLPASGKSTHAKHLADKYDANIHSSDNIREELSGDVNNQDINDLVFKTLHKHVKEDLMNGKSCIYDATNISYKKRIAFLQELKNIPCEKICVLIATPYEECLKRNTERERKVPEHVIKRMYCSFNIPYWYEGWDNIQIEYGEFGGYYSKPVKFYNNYKNYNQNNSHHKLTLGDHCQRAYLQLDPRASITAAVATYIHDCGKPETATFTNSRGVITEECHYYNHQYVSGYKALFFDISNPLDVAIIVMWHMQPYFWEKDNNKKQHNKYRKLWGECLYQDIMKLHEADKNAH